MSKIRGMSITPTCVICGKSLARCGYDLLILEICSDCIPDYSPALFIGEGYTLQANSIYYNTAPQGAFHRSSTEMTTVE